MAKEYEKCILHSTEWRNKSTEGNPSYWVCFTDSNGKFQRGYTGSNSGSGYTIENYRYCGSGTVIYLKYHFTKKKGTCVIDFIKHNTPEEVEAENAVKAKKTPDELKPEGDSQRLIEHLKEQIEKMKCCENCRHYSRTYGNCYSYDAQRSCESLSNWSLSDC